jgi:hAT family C-terminal dimerisation region
MEDDGIDIFNY